MELNKFEFKLKYIYFYTFLLTVAIFSLANIAKYILIVIAGPIVSEFAYNIIKEG